MEKSKKTEFTTDVLAGYCIADIIGSFVGLSFLAGVAGAAIGTVVALIRSKKAST